MDSSLHTLVVGKSSYSDGDEENAKEQVETVYRTYKIRFFGLTVIALSNIASSMNWSCVSPVPDVADKFFNNIGLTSINWFANVFMLTYLVAGPFSSWVYTRTSVKMGVSSIMRLFKSL
jgi:FLVCR family MFS transporter 7